MKILVTGAAGFIGYHTTVRLLQDGHEVFGLDNINDYYDVDLKMARLQMLGIHTAALAFNHEHRSHCFSLFSFAKINIEDKESIAGLCSKHGFDVVVHLAAQAGVRYSIQNPDAYVQSNLVGFLNVLEVCRHHKVSHLVYASSSSVYGLNSQIPFATSDAANHPVSLYAATKKANELMAHSYSHLYKLPTTGLRFFTVYGPWGRPDMAYSLFADAITKGKPIDVFNGGNMKRDFTYVDDVVTGILGAIHHPPVINESWDSNCPAPDSSSAPYRVYNLGNNEPVNLMEFIQLLETHLQRKAQLRMKEMQQGDVVSTWADISTSVQEIGYMPVTSIEDGIEKFCNWYLNYHHINLPFTLQAA